MKGQAARFGAAGPAVDTGPGLNKIVRQRNYYQNYSSHLEHLFHVFQKKDPTVGIIILLGHSEWARLYGIFIEDFRTALLLLFRLPLHVKVTARRIEGFISSWK